MKNIKNLSVGKVRNWIAVNAWNRQAGPMKGKRREEFDWKKEAEKELEELEKEEFDDN